MLRNPSLANQRNRPSRVAPAAFAIIMLCVPAASNAGDGRTELSQTCAVQTGCVPGDTPGFPVTLTASGSYVLTTSLTVATDTSAIVVEADHVRLDLNGFDLVGTHSCSPGSCSAGSASGISTPGFPPVGGGRMQVVDGRVRGFSGTCVQVGSGSQVTNVTVESCGSVGISAGGASRVQGNTVLDVGGSGLVFQGVGGTYGGNVVRNHALGTPSSRAVVGVVSANAGNSCPDSSCTPRGERRYYLSRNLVQGDLAALSCAVGFHMAHLYELLDMSHLYYDTGLGVVPIASTQPNGPVTNAVGWIRTGLRAGPRVDDLAGVGDCDDWSDSSAGAFGSAVELEQSWSKAPAGSITPWIPTTMSCVLSSRVWCIED